jgi:hypothetical protein
VKERYARHEFVKQEIRGPAAKNGVAKKEQLLSLQSLPQEFDPTSPSISIMD